MSENEALALLGIADTATLSQIKIAYWIKAKETHPDVGGNAAMFDDVTVAYHLLMRLAEDDRRSSDTSTQNSRSNPSPHRSNSDEIDLSVSAFGPVNDPLIKTDHDSISRLKS
jgi:DnaJ-class molecular chaperone